MAFTKTVRDIIDAGNGNIEEFGTWAAGGDTAATLSAADPSDNYSMKRVKICDIDWSDFAENSGHAVLKEPGDYPHQIKLTLSNGADSGTYRIRGKAR